jgi:diguanylate cyclase (GGDEF)-like protein
VTGRGNGADARSVDYRRTRPRLVVIVGALVALAVAMGIIGVLQLRDVYTTYDTLVQRDARMVKDLLEMKNALSDQVIGARGFIISRGDVEFLEPYYTGSLLFERELADARTKAEDAGEQAALDTIEAGYTRLRPIYEREIAFVQNGRVAEAVALVNGPGKAQKDSVVASLDALYREEEGELYSIAASADKTADRAIIEIVVLTAAVLVLGGVLVFLVWRLASALLRGFSESSERAATDALTGLANHGRFHERLNEEFARARRHNRDLSLVIIDLDHFKEVNDVHGHLVGDEVLKETAARLSRFARGGDVIARVGGEEFAWLMPETSEQGAFEVAERTRALISDQIFPGVGRVTTSAGVCGIGWADTPGDLFRLADGALYWAKSHGRDMSVVYAPEIVQELSLEEHAARVERERAVTAIVALARAVDARDPRTGAHSQAVAHLAAELAMTLGWPRDRVMRLREAALVHDVGKVGVPDELLFRQGSLTTDELNRVQAHAELGALIVADALDAEQVVWVRGHHERFDGTGYPDRLAGDGISQGARILHVADAWDAMTSFSPYAPTRTASDALEECRRCTGTQFCPDVVAALETLFHDRDHEAGLDVVRQPDIAVAGEAVERGEAPPVA